MMTTATVQSTITINTFADGGVQISVTIAGQQTQRISMGADNLSPPSEERMVPPKPPKAPPTAASSAAADSLLAVMLPSILKGTIAATEKAATNEPWKMAEETTEEQVAAEKPVFPALSKFVHADDPPVAKKKTKKNKAPIKLPAELHKRKHTYKPPNSKLFAPLPPELAAARELEDRELDARRAAFIAAAAQRSPAQPAPTRVFRHPTPEAAAAARRESNKRSRIKMKAIRKAEKLAELGTPVSQPALPPSVPPPPPVPQAPALPPSVPPPPPVPQAPAKPAPVKPAPGYPPLSFLPPPPPAVREVQVNSTKE